MGNPRFSICIPNFNYLNYLQLTCQSVLSQSFTDFEIQISDNQSEDGSIDFIKDFSKSKSNVKININPSNLGFSTNLEKATEGASGEYYILLSSDDLMNDGALASYSKIIDLCSPNRKVVIGSSVWRIDSEGKKIERSTPDPNFWRAMDIDDSLSEAMGYSVYKVMASEMLKRSLGVMGNPYYFLTVCYSNELFRQVGGYSGGRMYNPDKWFNWKLFSEADYILLIDEPLFSYRWHTQNQVALETSYGHLKYLVDEYRNTIELTERMLITAGMSRKEMEKSFIRRNILRHGIGEFIKGRWLKSLRIYLFGFSVFPGRFIAQPLFYTYSLLLLSSPLGSKLSKLVWRMPLKR